ncbi:hypothetical protein M3I53_36100 [Paraburkholderia sp. CNPSo 3272]|uniref:hypothetical protein n=1 Tax=Paraburkholderia sp. CNPSo 3272 TaxID=2940931 RepID=UPI0020B87A95|nr:hypothetical protein [Paraburkholderia sp. CNPSo 3272]MCP3728470.1 hypothetical protein [Paraburkholderia sp. CNPSo 3272]
MLHPTLIKILTELRQLAESVKATTSELRPSNIINNNNFGIVSIDRDELAARASALADLIEAQGRDDVPDEDDLLKYEQRLQVLRTHTAPQLFNGNAANAIPAYLFTLDSLERVLRPALSSGPENVAADGKVLRALRSRIRSLTAVCDDLEPKLDKLQEMADTIVRAYDAADRLPTDLQALQEARGEIKSRLDSAKRDSSEIELALFSAKRAKEDLDTRSSEAARIIEKCDSAMRASTAVGLGAAFHDRAVSLNWSMWPWIVGLLGALGAGAYFGGQQFHQLLAAIQESTSQTVVLTRVVVSLLSIGAPVWFAWIATKQIGQRFRLAEDYAYKASISKAYEGYRREAIELDAEFQTKLFASALARLDEQPLRFVEHETHGSPWHELLSSDVFKEAIRIAPELVGRFSNIARDTVESAKALKRKPNVKSTADASAEAQKVVE